MTRIVPIPKSDTKYFGDKTIPEFWLEIPASSPSVNNNNDYMNRLKNCLESAPNDGVICVFSEELPCKTLCESLAKARDNGNRIYILTNSYHDEMRNLEGCLIRYGGGKRIGSFILINPHSNMPSGCLFTGIFSDGSVNLSANLLFDLGTDQVSVLFRYFCYQFWNKAEKERIGGKEHNTESAPLDVFPPVGDACDFEYLKSVWGKEAENAQITASLLAESPYMKFTNFSHSKIVSLFSGIDDNMVRSLKQNQNEIYINNGTNLINSIKTPDGTWLIPKIDAAHEEEIYALLLNDEQIKILDKYIIMVSQGKDQYRYFESDTRENLSDKTIIKLGDSISKKYKIEPHSTIPVQLPSPSELLSWEDFEKQKPDFIDDDRSISIKYEWTIVPFTLPHKSDKHQLYQDWINAEKNINKYIDNIKESILENENRENKLSKLVARLFLSKQQKFSEYKNDLDLLRKIKYGGISNQELEDKIKEINKIRSAVEKDSGEILEEDRKARLQEQIKAEEEKQKKLEGELKETQQVLEETNQAVKNQSDNLKILEKQGNDKEDEIKEVKKKSDALSTARKRIKNDINSWESQISKITVNEKTSEEQLKNKEKLEKELVEKREAFQKKEGEEIIQSENLKELEKQRDAKSKEIKDAKTKSDDMAVKYKKIINEKKGLEREINKCKNNIIDFNEQLKNPDKEPQKKGSVLEVTQEGGKKPSQPEQTGELSVSDFPHLPSIGDLYKHNGQDYLAITNWEEYDQGKTEAKRLNAKLCAKGENNG